MASDGAKRKVPTRGAQLRYLEAGLDVLGRQGHAGLKLATVCEAVGATTGSFYHAFPNWPEYTSALIRYWREAKSDRLISSAREVADPVERLEFLIDIALNLPHDSEAAIRVWAAHDPAVRAIQVEADEERRQFIADAYFDATGNRELSERHATVAMYMLVGYESGTQRSRDDLAWAFRTFVEHGLSPAREE
ncbi:TetR/AcrR family transcriptional regulator [Rhodococcus phenolicus]|uniref:TetR/AcrR family transcriptional regulator n=1 Tax=Rhodococcus phenolicus TaxID=263849 RepID=UPI000830EE67|nr:TetR/AcrR family transcriptional regulator [Rhodococcus phenolicus]